MPTNFDFCFITHINWVHGYVISQSQLESGVQCENKSILCSILVRLLITLLISSVDNPLSSFRRISDLILRFLYCFSLFRVVWMLNDQLMPPLSCCIGCHFRQLCILLHVSAYDHLLMVVFIFSIFFRNRANSRRKSGGTSLAIKLDTFG